jgi:anti-sigma B factor antagonist
MVMIEIRTTQKFKEYRVVELSGRIDSSAAGGLEEVLDELIQSEKNLIIDMSGVNFISSQGMRVLLNTKKQVARGNGQVILTGLSGNVREVLSMLGFLEYFKVLDPDSDELGYYDFRDNATPETGL